MVKRTNNVAGFDFSSFDKNKNGIIVEDSIIMESSFIAPEQSYRDPQISTRNQHPKNAATHRQVIRSPPINANIGTHTQKNLLTECENMLRQSYRESTSQQFRHPKASDRTERQFASP